MQRDWEMFNREHVWVGMVREVEIKIEDEERDENLLQLVPPATAGDVEIEGKARHDHTFDSTTGQRAGEVEIRGESRDDNVPDSTSRQTAGHPNQTPNSSTNSFPANFPTLGEVRAAIPPGGILLVNLTHQFNERMHGRTRDFAALVHQAGVRQGVQPGSPCSPMDRLFLRPPITLPAAVRPASQMQTHTTFPLIEEIRAAIPLNGVSYHAFDAQFRPRVPPNRRNEFNALVNQVALQDFAAGRLMPRASSVPPATAPGSQTPRPSTFPTPEEIRAIIPADGLHVDAFNQVLNAKFRSRVPINREDEFGTLVNQLAKRDPVTDMVTLVQPATLARADTPIAQTPRPDTFPTADEIRAVIPSEGVDDNALHHIIHRHFHSRIPADRKDEIFALVQQVARRRGTTGLIVPYPPPPPPRTGSSFAQTPRNDTFPTAEEIRAAIPPEGVSIETLDAQFKARIPNHRRLAFNILLSLVSRVHSALIFQRPAPPEPASRETSFLQHTTNFPTLQEVQAAIPLQGAVVDDLLPRFIARVPVARAEEFLALLEQAGDFDEETGQIVPRPRNDTPVSETPASNAQSLAEFPTVAEIRAAIPRAGLEDMTPLLEAFMPRVPAGRMQDFNLRLERAVRLDEATGRIMRNRFPQTPAGGAPTSFGFPTLREIQATIPPTGIHGDALYARFAHRVHDERLGEYADLAARAGVTDSTTGMIMPRHSSVNQHAGPFPPHRMQPPGLMPPPGPVQHPDLIPSPNLIHSRHPHQFDPSRLPSFMRMRKRKSKKDQGKGKERRSSTPDQYGFLDDWGDLNWSLTHADRIRHYMMTRGGDMSTRRGGNENQEIEELTIVLRDEDVFPPLPPPRPIVINLKPKDLAKMPDTP